MIPLFYFLNKNSFRVKHGVRSEQRELVGEERPAGSCVRSKTGSPRSCRDSCRGRRHNEKSEENFCRNIWRFAVKRKGEIPKQQKVKITVKHFENVGGTIHNLFQK